MRHETFSLHKLHHHVYHNKHKLYFEKPDLKRHLQHIYFFKLFLGMFAAVFISLLALRMSADDDNQIALHVVCTHRMTPSWLS